jgi:hypothetical protein
MLGVGAAAAGEAQDLIELDPGEAAEELLARLLDANRPPSPRRPITGTSGRTAAATVRSAPLRIRPPGGRSMMLTVGRGWSAWPRRELGPARGAAHAASPEPDDERT